EELIVDRVTREGAVLTTRIQARDGQFIDPGPGLNPKTLTVASPTVTADRRFAIFDLLRKPSPIPVAVREMRMKAFDWFWAPLPGQVNQRMETVIVELASGRRVGFVDARHPQVVVSPLSNAFALSRAHSSRGPQTWEVYPLPPGTNWRWFFLIGVLPPLACLAGARVLRWRQSRRKTVGGPDLPRAA
ncbi:MAG TPA: hypothetical protein VM510_08570, partial [Caulifigura sp.]|nr:hypothetical protein [Caulifigura sp.]